MGRALLRGAGLVAAVLAGWVAWMAPTLPAAVVAVFLALQVVVLAEVAARGIPARAPMVVCPVCHRKACRSFLGLDGHSGMSTARVSFSPCGHTVFEGLRYTWR